MKKYIASGLYYCVYQIHSDRVIKIEKPNWQKRMKLLQWFELAQFFRSICQKNFFENNLVRSQIVAVYAKELLGNPVFKDTYNYEQDLVVPLKDYFRSHTLKECKIVIDSYVQNTYATWQKGFGDLIFNMGKNCGVTKNNEVVLHDFNEITFSRQTLLKQINRKKWRKNLYTNFIIRRDIREYVYMVCDQVFTEDKLAIYWKDNA